ncbi:MAG: methyltransferase domain-containing protein [Gemmatimonadaceae bacterium]|nr:methyltransferase domain-containing protein [Gemmatimonadaceae bacterium]
MTTIAWRTSRRKNFTRTSASIPRRLVREGKWYLLPAYALARTSDLAREGMENSGSFRFADHIYRAKPGGRYGIGWLLDALFLALPASRSMRERHLHSRLHIATALRRGDVQGESVRVLSVPCGIARDLVGGANDAGLGTPWPVAHARLIGMDLDPEALALSRSLAGRDGTFEFIEGDALDASSYPRELDLVVSTGFGEFLDDDDLTRFYAACLSALKPGGRFVTSGMSRSKLADRLLRELAELHTRYRDAEALRAALGKAGFTDIVVHSDRYGLQSLATAVRPAGTP